MERYGWKTHSGTLKENLHEQPSICSKAFEQNLNAFFEAKSMWNITRGHGLMIISQCNLHDSPLSFLQFFENFWFCLKKIIQNLGEKEFFWLRLFDETHSLWAGKAHLEKTKKTSCKEKLFTCIEFRTVHCTHNWIQFPALKQIHKNVITFDSTTHIIAS